jgi:rhodanese-related sulfurtransferase
METDMNKKILPILIIIILVMLVLGCNQSQDTRAPKTELVSSDILNGYRVLTISSSIEKPVLKVYRGDYIQFRFDGAIGEPILSIPALSIKQRLPEYYSDAPYFKMNKIGNYSFSLGNVSGIIEVIEYRQVHYEEVTPKQAAQLIKDTKPFILDVRTPGEYKSGHLKDAVLIPLQVLQKRAKELFDYKNRVVFIYCSTGNRSTVASKILIDMGFNRIINLREGIAQWRREKYPVVR